MFNFFPCWHHFWWCQPLLLFDIEIQFLIIWWAPCAKNPRERGGTPPLAEVWVWARRISFLVELRARFWIWYDLNWLCRSTWLRWVMPLFHFQDKSTHKTFPQTEKRKRFSLWFWVEHLRRASYFGGKSAMGYFIVQYDWLLVLQHLSIIIVKSILPIYL